MKKRIGVLDSRGVISEHSQALEKLSCEVIEVHKTGDLDGLNGLIISGGESTAIGELLQIDGMGEKIKELAKQDFPIFGISAGMMLLSKNFAGSQYSLALMDMSVSCNAFGGQDTRFEADLKIPVLGYALVRAIFIQALFIQSVAPNVGILAEFDQKIVFVRQGNMLASTFFTEPTSDNRVYQYFLDIVDEEMSK